MTWRGPAQPAGRLYDRPAATPPWACAVTREIEPPFAAQPVVLVSKPGVGEELGAPAPAPPPGAWRLTVTRSMRPELGR